MFVVDVLVPEEHFHDRLCPEGVDRRNDYPPVLPQVVANVRERPAKIVEMLQDLSEDDQLEPPFQFRMEIGRSDVSPDIFPGNGLPHRFDRPGIDVQSDQFLRHPRRAKMNRVGEKILDPEPRFARVVDVPSHPDVQNGLPATEADDLVDAVHDSVPGEKLAPFHERSSSPRRIFSYIESTRSGA